MSACAMLSYNNVTPDAWKCAIKAAAEYGVTITGNTGSASASGFTIGWNYDPKAQTAQVQCTDSPFWAPCSTINSHLNDAIEACLSHHEIEMTKMVSD
jgi:hypothetical protein